MAFKLPNSSIKAAITKTGYRSDSKDVNNDVNIIPSNKITMVGVEFDVKGVGNNGVKKHMKPGKKYDFGDADYVVETPLKHCGCGVIGPKRFGATGHPGDKKAFGKDKGETKRQKQRCLLSADTVQNKDYIRQTFTQTYCCDNAFCHQNH